MDRVKRFISKDGVVDFIFIIAAEGRLLKKHLVDQNTKSPPIDGPTIFLIQEDLDGVSQASRQRERIIYLRCHKFRSATKGTGAGPIPHLLFAKPVVRDFDVAIKGQQDVIQFEIAIYNTVLVEILQRQTNLGSIESATLQ